jgi:phosphoenolpyruvate carboxykinase (ATP)
MVRHPVAYAEMLGDRLRTHDAACWLVNTGLTGGPYGTGRRVPLAHTRRMVQAVLAGELADVPMTRDGVFGLAVPEAVPGVPTDVLRPRATWDDPAAYDAQARTLAEMFVANFAAYADAVPEAVAAAGPRLEAPAR